MRTLVAAVGYRNLRDHSVQFEILERLQREELGREVLVEDTSYNPIAVAQWLEGETHENRFDRAIFIAAVERGRLAGTVTAYRWDGVLPPDEEVQQAVVEAVTGVIALENTVVITGYFGVIPLHAAIVEIEPRDHTFGSQLSDEVAEAVDPATQLVRRLALEPSTFESLPVRPLPRRHTSKVQA